MKGIVLVNLAQEFGYNPAWLLMGEGEIYRKDDQPTDALDVPTFIRNGTHKNHYSYERDRQNGRTKIVVDNSDIARDDHDGAIIPSASVRDVDAAYVPKTPPPSGDQAAVIVQLLARILAAGKPKLINMVALYLQNITTLIDDDPGKPGQ